MSINFVVAKRKKTVQPEQEAERKRIYEPRPGEEAGERKRK